VVELLERARRRSSGGSVTNIVRTPVRRALARLP
jgi:hypothetical protein